MPETIPDVAGLLPHRACRNCMQIKVKCIPRNIQEDSSQTICERCHRLGKACMTPSPVVRKRKRDTTSKVAQLEDRINRLSSLLTPIPSPEATLTASSRGTTHESLHQQQELRPRTPTTEGQSTQSQQNQLQNDNDTPIFTCPSRRREHSANRGTGSGRDESSLSAIIAPPHLVAKENSVVGPADICPMYLDSSLEAKLFEDYRRNFGLYFPFVIIPTSATARLTKKERPFVFWSALAVSSLTHKELHYPLHEQLLRCIGEEMLPKAHKSLDLLQGILILINWFHYYSPINPQMANILHLAQALMIDLGLSRPLNHRQSSRVATDISDVYHGKQVIHGTRTSDAKRALLGVFWCASRMALCFERIEPINFSKHMDKCCKGLEDDMEYESDAFIIQVVRLHQITSRYLAANFSYSELPTKFLKSTIDREIKQFVAKLPDNVYGRREILMEVEGCKLSLLGPCHLGNHGLDVDSAESLYASLVATEKFTEFCSSLSPQDFVSLPIWYFFTYIIGALAELSFLNADHWDLSYVRQRFGFVTIMHRYINQIEATRAYADEIASPYLSWRFNLYGEKMRRCLKWYEAKIGFDNRPTTSHDATAAEEYSFNADTFNDFNDPLWDSIMGDWTNAYNDLLGASFGD